MSTSLNPDEIAAAASARTVVADAAALAATLTTVADQAATRAVELVFLRLGVDLSDKAAVYTTKEAFGWLIRFKRRVDRVYAALLPAAITTAVSSVVGLFVYIYKS